MNDLSVTLIQSQQFWEDKFKNLHQFEKLFKQISKTDLIVLPEMFHTGFSMNTDELAENMNDSLALDWLKNHATKLNSAIYTSFIVKENNQFYNRGVFVFPDGNFQTYDKRKLFSLVNEDQYYTPGNKQVLVSYKSWKINLQICYDLRFPEISRNKLNKKGEADYDLCLYIANWPEKRIFHWKSLLLARAIENQCYVVGVNCIGTDGKGLIYSGDSQIIDALGKILTEKNTYLETINTILLSKKSLKNVRNSFNFLKDVK